MGSLAENLRRLREAHNWTQGDLADRAGVHRRSVQNWEYGDCEPDRPRTKRLVEALGCTTAELEGHVDIGDRIATIEAQRESDVLAPDDAA